MARYRGGEMERLLPWGVLLAGLAAIWLQNQLLPVMDYLWLRSYWPTKDADEILVAVIVALGLKLAFIVSDIRSRAKLEHVQRSRNHEGVGSE